MFLQMVLEGCLLRAFFVVSPDPNGLDRALGFLST